MLSNKFLFELYKLNFEIVEDYKKEVFDLHFKDYILRVCISEDELNVILSDKVYSIIFKNDLTNTPEKIILSYIKNIIHYYLDLHTQITIEKI